MDFSQLADIADVLAAFGVIASLVFVAYEIRRNTKEAARTKWETTIDRLVSMWGRTSGEGSPEIIHKGRQDFESLSGPEKITFQNYHFELLLALEAVFVVGADQIHGEEVLEVSRRHLRHHLSFEGTRHWWTQFASRQGLSSMMMHEVEEAIRTGV